MTKNIFFLLVLLSCIVSYGQQCIPMSIKLKYKNTQELIPVFIKAHPDKFKQYSTKNSSVIKIQANFNHYFSAYITYDALTKISKLPFVYQIQDGSMKIFPFNDSMRLHTKVNFVHNGQSPLNAKYLGEGILIGIIDFGLDFRHPDFKQSSGHNRIIAIWDQNDSLSPPYGYNYGREWTSTSFDNNSCYYTEIASSFGHGTHVTGIACGNGSIDSNMRGVAPKSKIIAVNLKDNNTFMNQIVDGISYIFKKADSLNIPCVINISLGTYEGSHDGYDIATQMIDSLILAKKSRAVVASAGNSGNFAQHITMQPNNVDTLYTYFTYTSGFKGSYFNFWADTQNMRNLSVSINADSNTTFKKASNIYTFQFKSTYLDTIIKKGSFEDSLYIQDNTNDTIALMYYSGSLQGKAINWNIYIVPKNSSLIWKFCSFGLGKIDLWVHPQLQTTSAIISTAPSSNHMIYKSADSSMSLASGLQSSEHIITVGNYSTKNTMINIDQNIYSTTAVIGSISSSSSLGPTRDLKQKPDVVAPGNFIQSTVDTLTRKTALINSGMRKKLDPSSYYYINGGTSMASPVVAGCIALFLEKNPTFDLKKIWYALTKSAMTDSFTGTVPNYCFGYGKVDAYKMLTYPLSVGCKDTGSINYSITAVFEDSSICIKKRYGCMDTASINYDSTANTNNFSCIPKVYGVLDSSCVNYNILANVSSGVCIPKVYGCTDSLATNFNPSANVNNGSCIYIHSNIVQINSDRFNIYPNPAQNILKISNNSNVHYDIKIYTIDGRLVEVTKIQRELTLSIQNLSEGQYKILFEAGNEKKWFMFSIVR